VKILVLGNSDTAGRFSEGETWTGVARDAIAAGSDGGVSLTEIRFSALGADSPKYAERKVREIQPDLVILPLGTFAFTVGFVWVRVRRLVGARPAAWYKRLEDGFDRRTRKGGGLRRTANRWARKAVRATVGAEPLTSRAALTESYRQILRTMSRIEDVDVLLVAYPLERGPSVVKARTAGQRRQKFLAEMAEEAEAHHHAILHCDQVFDRTDDGAALITPDGFHLSTAGHRVLGEAVAALVATRE
jgi:hypothetical protein